MKTLHIIVANKIATYSNRSGEIVCGNSDYQIEFNFDAEWDVYETKTARFIWNGKYKDIVFTGTVCPVPIVANTNRLEVGVYADELCTTTSAVITCIRSIRCNSNIKSEGTVVVPEGTPTLIAKTITENGKYLASTDGADGFYEVKVNVPTGSGEDIPEYNEVEDFKLDVSGLDTELEISYSVSEKVALPAGRNILAYTEDENFTPSNIKKGVSIFGLTGTSSTPAEISTEAEMTALLTSGEIGGVYKYTGPTGTYENGALYVLENANS